MRCGNCGATAPDMTSAQVRNCYNKVNGAHPSTNKANEPMSPPTEAQVTYLLILQSERVLPPNYVHRTREQIMRLERPDVSALISALKSAQRLTSGEENQDSRYKPTWTMPAGRYALYNEAGPGYKTGSWKFYQVDKPKDGRWKGYTFIKLLVGSPGSYQKVEMRANDRQTVLKAIEADPKKAMIDFGLQSGECGRCHSPLTDPDSLARGLGPKCATKSGWF